MSTTPARHGYDEPTVMWRMVRADGLSSHAVIDPRLEKVAVLWYVNGRLLGFRAFDDWTAALQWSDQMHAQNWTAGWRPAPES